jgi:hypothetical protein
MEGGKLFKYVRRPGRPDFYAFNVASGPAGQIFMIDRLEFSLSTALANGQLLCGHLSNASPNGLTYFFSTAKIAKNHFKHKNLPYCIPRLLNKTTMATENITNVKEALTYVADELMFIFFPDVFQDSNNDEWTIKTDMSSSRDDAYERRFKELEDLSSAEYSSFETYDTEGDDTEGEGSFSTRKSNMIAAMKKMRKARKQIQSSHEEECIKAILSHRGVEDTKDDISEVNSEEVDTRIEVFESMDDKGEEEKIEVEASSEIDVAHFEANANKEGIPASESSSELLNRVLEAEFHATTGNRKVDNVDVFEVEEFEHAEEVIDVSDTQEVIDLTGNGRGVTNLGTLKRFQRLERLRMTREKLRTERERWESEFAGNVDLQHCIQSIKDKRLQTVIETKDEEKAVAQKAIFEKSGLHTVNETREAENSVFEKDIFEMPVFDKHLDLNKQEENEAEENREHLAALTSTTMSKKSNETKNIMSEEEIIEYHREEIQTKIQLLSQTLDMLMLKKLSGEFPDTEETREMENEIRANILEFQQWWHPELSQTMMVPESLSVSLSVF